MRIVQINVNYGFGSTGIIVKDLQSICLKHGIECEVVYVAAKGLVTNGYQIGNPLTNKLHALLSRVAGKQGYFSYLTTCRLLRHLKQQKVDAIHLHNLHSGYVNVPMLLRYAAKHDIPLIVTLHDCWFYTGGCCHYTTANCFRWKDTCGSCPKCKEEVHALLWDGTEGTLRDRYKLFGAIRNLYAVGVSQWIVDEARQTVFKHANCMTIRNGVDTKFFYPSESDMRKKLSLEGKFVILAPANKWFLDVNRATFDYFASRLSDDMRMVFIGNGCDESLLTDKMMNYGFVSSREEIRNVYSMADVMLNCTREESLSLLNVEVQSCGTPVITYANTGVRETVDDRCGFAVENGNPEAMWNALMDIKQRGKASLSTDCVEWVKKEFDKEKNYQKYLQLYRTIMG